MFFWKKSKVENFIKYFYQSLFHLHFWQFYSSNILIRNERNRNKNWINELLIRLIDKDAKQFGCSFFDGFVYVVSKRLAIFGEAIVQKWIIATFWKLSLIDLSSGRFFWMPFLCSLGCGWHILVGELQKPLFLKGIFAKVSILSSEIFLKPTQPSKSIAQFH